MSLNVTYKNKVLGEYTREELENDFIKNCEALDKKSNEIVELENKAQHLSQRLSRLATDMQERAKSPRRFTGSQAPSAFRQSQITVRELQEQIEKIQTDIDKDKKEHENILKQISYFQAIPTNQTNKAKYQGALNKSGITKGMRTREEIISMLQSLLAQNSIPQMKNRIEATIAILEGDYDAAEAPMKPILDSVGESLSLKQCIEQRIELNEREIKIEQLRQKLGELKERYNEMLKKQQEMTKQYQEEAEQNAARNQEIYSLQAEKEKKENEIAKTSELEIIAAGLQKEIAQLEEQKKKLQTDTSQRQQLVQTQVKEALEKLRSEVKSVEQRCDEARSANEELEKRLKEAEAKAQSAIDERRKAEEEFERLQSEYESAAGTFGRMIDHSDRDPFEDRKFVAFLARMKEKGWTPESIRRMTEETAELNQKMTSTKEKIAQYEAAEKELNQKIAEKRTKISDLQNQLRELAADLNDTKLGQPRSMPEFEKGAPDIVLSNVEETSGSTQIGILFKTLTLEPAVVGNKPSDIFFVIDFLDTKREGEHIDINEGGFNEPFVFTVSNDFILREYLDKTSTAIQLCRDRDGRTTEVARSELNLLPFLSGTLEFTSSAKLWNSRGKPVGEFTFQAKMLDPPVEKDQ